MGFIGISSLICISFFFQKKQNTYIKDKGSYMSMGYVHNLTVCNSITRKIKNFLCRKQDT